VPPPSRTRRPLPPAPGTVFVHAVGDAVTMPPKEGRELIFGRNRPEVHLCVGEDDLTVSRKHGTLTNAEGHWWLRNTGILAIRIGESRLLTAHDEAVPLAEGYTSLVIEGSRGRLHLIEVLVGGRRRARRRGTATRPGRSARGTCSRRNGWPWSCWPRPTCATSPGRSPPPGSRRPS